jgi:uncharacterized membrane protein YkgB
MIDRLLAACPRLEQSGALLLRYSLVLVFAGFGYIKFFPFEAEALAPLFAASPVLGWLPDAFGAAGASRALGVAELTTAMLLAVRPISPRLSILGGLMSVATFATTLSLMLSLPIWEASAGGFPALNGIGAFLLKDAVLLAASIAVLAESLSAAARGSRAPRRAAKIAAGGTTAAQAA